MYRYNGSKGPASAPGKPRVSQLNRETPAGRGQQQAGESDITQCSCELSCVCARITHSHTRTVVFTSHGHTFIILSLLHHQHADAAFYTPRKRRGGSIGHSTSLNLQTFPWLQVRSQCTKSRHSSERSYSPISTSAAEITK